MELKLKRKCADSLACSCSLLLITFFLILSQKCIMVHVISEIVSNSRSVRTLFFSSPDLPVCLVSPEHFEHFIRRQHVLVERVCMDSQFKNPRFESTAYPI